MSDTLSLDTDGALIVIYHGLPAAEVIGMYALNNSPGEHDIYPLTWK